MPVDLAIARPEPVFTYSTVPLPDYHCLKSPPISRRLSGFLGLATQSIAVFILCFAILIVGLLHDGSLRMTPTRR